MPLTPGTRVGNYEVISKIGEGGIGEVYRGRDTRLTHEVALKTLPESLKRDPDRIARFEREAQTLAGLNHPNIAIIHGVNWFDVSPDGQRFLTSPVVATEAPGGQIHAILNFLQELRQRAR